MKYVQGFVHSKFAREHYYEICNDFTISILKEGKRYAELLSMDDYENLTHDFELKKGDIICVRYFKNNENTTSYTYLENVNDVLIKNETIISREFVDCNPSLFVNVTNIIERDKKIDKILE